MSVGSAQRPLPGDRPERRVADLDRDRPGPRRRTSAAAPATPSAIASSVRSMTSRSRRVDVERVLVADRLRRVAVVDRVGVDARGRGRPATRRACRSGGRRGRGARPARSPIVRTPYSAQRRRRSARRRPTAAQIGSGARNAASSPGGTTTSPSGLRRSEAILATSLVVATPTEAVSPTSSRTAVLDRARDRRARRRTASNEPVTSRNASSIEMGSTSGVKRAQDGHDVAARLLVAAPVDRDEDAVRAAADRLAQRHRRVDAELARLVARRRDDAAARPDRRPDDDRPAAQLGAVALLDGREERVEVDVEDRPVGHGRYHRPAVEAPTSTVPDRGLLALGVGVVAGVVVAWFLPTRRPGPRLARPLRRARLDPRPAGRARPAGPGRRRRRGRRQRLPVGAPRRRRRARRRASAGRPCSPRRSSWSSSRSCSRGSATRGWRR